MIIFSPQKYLWLLCVGNLRIACSITPLRQRSKTLCDIGNPFLVGIKVIPKNWDSKHWDSPCVNCKMWTCRNTSKVAEWVSNGEVENRLDSIQECLCLTYVEWRLDDWMIHFFAGLKSSTLRDSNDINKSHVIFVWISPFLSEASRERIERKEAFGKGLIVMMTWLPNFKETPLWLITMTWSLKHQFNPKLFWPQPRLCFQ